MAEQRRPLVSHIFTADPSAHVFNDKIYIYPSHDIPHDGEDNDDGDEYRMEDYHILSMDNLEAECVDNGEALHMKDVPWVSKQMWAPDAAYKNGIYYLYFPARDKEGIFRIGVATSDSPVGPFKPEENYMQGTFSIDPGQLEKWKTGKFDPNGSENAKDEPEVGPMVGELAENMLELKGSYDHIKILDENGKEILAGDENRRYFEDPWMHKYNGKYYFSYSTGTTHFLVYAVGDSPVGPFTYQGKILEPVLGWTTHHSIMEYHGKWYLFYHDCELSKGINHRRNVKYTELKYREDGSIITIEPYK